MPIKRFLTSFILSMFFGLMAWAISIDSTNRFGDLRDNWNQRSIFDHDPIASIGESSVSPNGGFSLAAIPGDLQSYAYRLHLDSSAIDNGGYTLGSAVISTKSLELFSLSLWFLGLSVACLGLFSLCLEKRIGGIHSRELAHQLSTLNLFSAARNVSNNWRIKKEARWFVLMGLASMALALLSWLL